MSEIHVPIDYSDLKDNLPPGEDIIYSTLAKGTLMQMNSRTTWICHVLITNKTFAYSLPKKKSFPLMMTGGNVRPLYDVKNFAPKIIWVYNEVGRGTLTFNLHRDSNFETKDKYKQRSWMFGEKENEFILAAKKERLNEMESHPEDFKKKKIEKMRRSIRTLEKIMTKYQKGYEKLKKKYG